MDKYFLTDIDNCLLDWSESFARWLGKHAPELNLNFKQYSLGLDSAVLDFWVDKFNKDHDAFSSLIPCVDAAKWFPKIHNELGYKVVGISSCLGDATTYELREQNLINTFGDIWDDIICIEIHGDKLPILQDYPTNSFWVEDKFHNAAKGVEAGHRSMLFDRVYNHKTLLPTSITRVKNWKQIYDIVAKG